MKQVWKCDYCSNTNENKDIIRKHENECCFNPKERRCYTCKNREEYAYSDGYYCSLELDTDDVDFKPCDSWIIDVKNLKDNINKF